VKFSAKFANFCQRNQENVREFRQQNLLVTLTIPEKNTRKFECFQQLLLLLLLLFYRKTIHPTQIIFTIFKNKK